MREATQHETLITSHRGLFEVNWKEFWRSRNLLFVLVRRDFLAKYQQSLLGPLWFVLQPCLTTVVLTLVFNRGLKMSTSGAPPILFYFCGLLPWGYFAHGLSVISNSLVVNRQFINKVYFPRLIIPIAVVLFDLIAFAMQLGVFLAVYLYFIQAGLVGFSVHIHPGIVLILPILILQTMLVALGFGLWIASLTVKYRDFQYITPILIQLWMFATPVIYPMAALSKKWKIIMSFNPMAGIVEAYRYVFFGTQPFHGEIFFISSGVTLAIFFAGILLFNKVERTMADNL